MEDSLVRDITKRIDIIKRLSTLTREQPPDGYSRGTLKRLSDEREFLESSLRREESRRRNIAEDERKTGGTPNHGDYYIECKGWGWTWAHKDYDGPGDPRCGMEETHQECVDAITECELDIDEELRDSVDRALEAFRNTDPFLVS
jgi:hypothetical protein